MAQTELETMVQMEITQNTDNNKLPNSETDDDELEALGSTALKTEQTLESILDDELAKTDEEKEAKQETLYDDDNNNDDNKDNNKNDNNDNKNLTQSPNSNKSVDEAPEQKHHKEFSRTFSITQEEESDHRKVAEPLPPQDTATHIDEYGNNDTLLTIPTEHDGLEETMDTENTENIDDEIYREGPPISIYGEEMVKYGLKELQQLGEDDEEYWCYCCEFTFNVGMEDEYFWHCPSEKRYNLCITCSNQISDFNDRPIKKRHKIENMYYIYNNDEIKGPYLLDELLTTYVHRKLDTKYMYIMRADQCNDGEWVKFEFPQNIFTEVSEYDQKRFELIDECARLNEQVRVKYPEIYDSLIEDVLSGKLRMVDVPQTIPIDEQTSSWFKAIIRNLGRILAIFIVIILFLHCIPTIIVGLIFAAILYCILEHVSNDFSVWSICFIFAISYSGMILWPIIDIAIFNSRFTDDLTRIKFVNGFIIPYFVWGITSYILSTIYVSTAYLQKGYQTMSQFVLSLILFDFNGLDLLHTGRTDLDWTTFIGLTYIFPSLLSLLPAAIFGYIMNPSSEHTEPYSFIGGLAGYILATWCAIRIFGYLLVNAFPQLEVYINKEKN